MIGRIVNGNNELKSTLSIEDDRLFNFAQDLGLENVNKNNYGIKLAQEINKKNLHHLGENGYLYKQIENYGSRFSSLDNENQKNSFTKLNTILIKILSEHIDLIKELFNFNENKKNREILVELNQKIVRTDFSKQIGEIITQMH